jgi:hypothetical protein
MQKEVQPMSEEPMVAAMLALTREDETLLPEPLIELRCALQNALAARRRGHDEAHIAESWYIDLVGQFYSRTSLLDPLVEKAADGDPGRLIEFLSSEVADAIKRRMDRMAG